MSMKFYNDEDIQGIANAIRTKNGSSDTYKVEEMANEILNIPSGQNIDNINYTQKDGVVSLYMGGVSYSGVEYQSGTSHITDKESNIYIYGNGTDRPQGAQITIPQSGTLTIIDGEKSATYGVASGSKTIYNITPGNKGIYINRNFNGDIVKIGTLTPIDSGLRMIYLNDTRNVRDLGGWECDNNSTIEYGKIFRGSRLFINYENNPSQNPFNIEDKITLHDLLGIQYELDIRWPTDAHPPKGYSYIGKDVGYTHINGKNYSDPASQEDVIKNMLDIIFDCVQNEMPIYIHCMAGADRTGTLMMVLEGLLGVSLSDIDKDYELTTFFAGFSSSSTIRARDESDWINLMTSFLSLSGDTLRDKLIKWLIPLGISMESINSYRNSMIVGGATPLPMPDFGTVTISNNLQNATSDNISSTIGKYSSYSATISANQGYTLTGANIEIKMVIDGVDTDITNDAYNNGNINIPIVKGNISIKVIAVSEYYNLFDINALSQYDSTQPNKSVINCRMKKGNNNTVVYDSYNGMLVTNLIEFNPQTMQNLNVNNVSPKTSPYSYTIFVMSFDSQGNLQNTANLYNTTNFVYSITNLVSLYPNARSVKFCMYLKDDGALTLSDIENIEIYAS